MKTCVTLAVLLASAWTLLGAEAAFTVQPTAKRDGERVKIAFAVSAPTDVEVAILDKDGKVVRHLAAGAVGKNAPAPFRKAALDQELVWDLEDDRGKAAAAAAVSVRVRLGLKAELERFIPGTATPLSAPTALGVGLDGTVYVLSQRDKAGGATLFALDRNGKYLRTILPSPAGLKKDQVKGMERLTLADGSEVPIVYNPYITDFAPYLSGFRPQQLAVTKDHWIVFASGGNNWCDQIVPRHALVLKSDGTTPPEVGFIGPPLGPYGRYSIGLRPQQLALSPDGKTLYFAGMGRNAAGRNPAQGLHTIGRTTWGSAKDPEPFIGLPDEPGSDATHLNDPVSVATDDKGTIYVVDQGNNRIAAFDPTGKYLGETTVARPRQVGVHPSGALYVLTEPDLPKGQQWGPFAVIKFDKAVGGRETARLDFRGRYPVLALDAGANPPKLWLTYDPAWRVPPPLVPLTDAGGGLAAGEDVLKRQAPGFTGPLYLCLDAGRERLYVGDYSRSILKVDLKTDAIAPFLQASEAAVDRDGNVYVLSGYGTNALLRFDPEGKPVPFTGTGTNKIEVKYRAGLPHVGVRGLTVTPGGDLYVFSDAGDTAGEQLHVFGPDGKLKQESLLRDIPPDSGMSVAVDRAGNVYAGINVHDPKHLYPDELAGQVPPVAWERTYSAKSSWYNWPQRKIPPAPWERLYLNYYLYHYGYVFKFPPTGGRFWVGGKPVEGENPRPAGVPAQAREYRTGLLGKVVWADGALWTYQGFSLCANRTESSGDPTCSCYSSRFAMDEYERLFVPDVFRFRVTVLDAAGNELARIGQYGNVDAVGPGVPLATPNAVAVGGGKVYILDRKSRRIVVARLGAAAEGVCQIK